MTQADRLSPTSPSAVDLLRTSVRSGVLHGEAEAHARPRVDRLFAIAKSLSMVRDRFGLEAVCDTAYALGAVPLEDLVRFRNKLQEASPWGTSAPRCQAHQAQIRAQETPHRWGPYLAHPSRRRMRATAALLEIYAWSGDGTIDLSVAAVADLLGSSERAIKRHRSKFLDLGLVEDLGLAQDGVRRYRWLGSQPEAATKEMPTPPSSPSSDTPSDTPALIREKKRWETPAAAPEDDPWDEAPVTLHPEDHVVLRIPTTSGSWPVNDQQLTRWRRRWPDRDVLAILGDAQRKARQEAVRDGFAWCQTFLRVDRRHLYSPQGHLEFPDPVLDASPPESSEALPIDALIQRFPAHRGALEALRSLEPPDGPELVRQIGESSSEQPLTTATRCRLEELVQLQHDLDQVPRRVEDARRLFVDLWTSPQDEDRQRVVRLHPYLERLSSSSPFDPPGTRLRDARLSRELAVLLEER